MVKLCLCHLLCLFLALSLSACDDRLLGVSTGSQADANWPNALTKSGFSDTVDSAPVIQHNSFSLEPQRPSQPVVAASEDGGLEETASDSSTGTQDHSQNNHGILDSPSAFGPHTNDQGGAGIDRHGRVLGLLSQSTTDTDMENRPGTENRAQNRHGNDNNDNDNGFQADNTYQGSHRNEADLGVLGHSRHRFPDSYINKKVEQGDDLGVLGHSGHRFPDSYINKVEQGENTEGKTQDQADLQVPDTATHSGRTNNADLGVLGEFADSSVNDLNGNKAETEHRTETQQQDNPTGVLGAFYVRPSLSENGRQNQGGTDAMPAENRNLNSKYGVLGLQGNSNFKDEMYGESQTPSLKNIFRGIQYEDSRGSSDAANGENVEPRLENGDKAFSADESGSGGQQQQLSKAPGLGDADGAADDDDNHHDADGAADDDDNHHDGAVTDQGADSVMRTLTPLLNTPRHDFDSEEEDTSDDYDDEDADNGGGEDDDNTVEDENAYGSEEEKEDDSWYYNPDQRGQDSTPSSPTWTASSSTSMPWSADDDEDSAEKDKPTEPTDKTYHEKVVELAGVEYKKSANGPKESIILYTAIIVVFIAGIVLFTVWKKSKKYLPNTNVSAVQTMEEGKRLLDHPFV